MFKKFAVILCALSLLLSLAACGEVAGDIAGNVAEAAKAELEKQVKATFEKYKIDILDMKTTVGKLNGAAGDVQFFCAVLVQSDSDAIPQSAADALGKLFHDAGITVQTGTEIRNSYLEHKSLTYKDGIINDSQTYYTVWCYTDRLPSLEDLKDLKSAVTAEGVG